ncbi:MAG: ParB/RepB/Spo0J family partition protein [Gemmatimonadetes bacterium]|nr:ParB/RepB/Spo0J family partition protein [Gemmatimonadota bacterium]
MSESRRLGRGLESLLGPMSKEQAEAQGALREIPVAAIDSNPYQPRREFEPEALKELVDSIEASGLLQPIIVRAKGAGRYELIAGERRWRAVRQLGWQKVPAVLKDVDDQAMLTLALIENLQRDDLSPLDEAVGYERLVKEFHLAQSEVARLVGKDRATVANTLRLLKLPADIQVLVQHRTLTEGHARALLGLTDEQLLSRMGQDAAEHGWSVRELEARVRGEVPGRRKKAGHPVEKAQDPEVRRVEEALRQRLQTDVRVTARRRGRGFVTISYYSNDDLARVLETVLGAPFDG